MHLLFSNLVFTEEVIRVLSRTLVHSLWQGMALALVAGCIVFFTKKTSPATRYNLLTVALLIFVIGITATFCTQLVMNAPVVQNEQAPAPALITSPLLPHPLAAENTLSLAARAEHIFNANAGWIVWAWLLIIVLRSVQLTFGLYGVYRLKKRQTFSSGEYWNRRVTELGRQLKINRQVKLLQSGIAGVPAVIGYFKPVILFPLGMLASLPPNEVEAILIHELAHIRRKDFLVNMLQHIVEMLFFFNPGVRWVSSLIRLERESCCDAIAVSQTHNKRSYINALITFQGFDLQLARPLANAFANEKNHLMNRVKRIIYNNNKTLNNMEKKFLAAGMVITSVFIFAFSPDNLQRKTLQINPVFPATDILGAKKIPSQTVTASDTVPAMDKEPGDVLNGTINSVQNGTKYKIVVENEEVTELYVNGKKVPAEKMAGYHSITKKIMTQSKLDMVQSKLDMIQSKKDMEEAQKEMEESKISHEQAEKEMAEAKEEMEKAREEMSQDMEENSKQMKLSKKEMEESKLEMEQAKKEMAENMMQAKLDMEQAKKDIAQSKRDVAQSRRDVEQSRKDVAESKKMQENMIGDFIKENIIKDKKELTSYKLSNEELIVNGVKQPAAVHKRFKDKYVKAGNWTMEYHYNYEKEVK